MWGAIKSAVGWAAGLTSALGSELGASLIGSGAKGLLGLGDKALDWYYDKKAFDRMIAAQNTAHQREVNDLRAAGLNPILSTHGQGAGTPNLDTPNGSSLADAVDAGISAYSVKKSVENQTKQADASKETAEANKINAKSQMKNADTNQWQIYTAEEMGSLGFKVRVPLELGGDGHIKTVRTIRINKVTGETYDALTGERINIIDEVPISSAKGLGSSSAEYKPIGQPIVIDDDDIRSFYQRQKHNAPPWRVTR